MSNQSQGLGNSAALRMTAAEVAAVQGSVAIGGTSPVGWPNVTPGVMSSPPTLTAGVANAASAIAGSVRVQPFREDCFTYLGGSGVRPTTFPLNLGIRLGGYPLFTSATPTAIEFDFTTSDATGRFEIATQGSLVTIRVLVMDAAGRWQYATSGASFSHAADSQGYLDLVTLGAAGTYSIRLEFNANGRFWGINAGPTDTLRARPRPAERVIVVGDSFTEPTFSDGGSFVTMDGWAQRLAYSTGWDVWGAGSGGTGYVNPGSGGRVKARDRLAGDIIPYSPTKIIWALGINDRAYTYAEINAEAAACFAQVAAALPRCEQIVLAPFWPSGITGFPADILNVSDAIRDAASAARLRFIDLLQQPVSQYLLDYGDAAWASTLTSATTVGGSTAVVASIPSYFLQASAGLNEWHVRIGSGAVQVVRRVTNITGSGPYTLTLANTVGQVIASGQPVVLGAESYITGTGRQGATNGTGNADVVTGPDGTHWTRFGHAHGERVIRSALARSYSGR